MQMKKLILLTVVAALPLTLMAQDDDMYFVPTKENVAKEAKAYGMPKNVYYSGSQRNVDEYNRRAWSSVTPIDSAGNDIIDFSAVRGVYPDSAYSEVTENDYKYTKRMSRFEGYTSTDVAYWEGYRDGRWMSPWYYSSYYPWYDSYWYWNDPWYYGSYYSSYYGWYSPWYYGGYYRPWRYYGWYGPRYHYGGGINYRPSGSGSHHISAGGYRGWSNGSRARSERRTTPATRRFGEASGTYRSNNSSYSNRSFGSSGGYSGGTRSSSSSSGSFGGGGGRSGGGSRGGSFGTRR